MTTDAAHTTVTDAAPGGRLGANALLRFTSTIIGMVSSGVISIVIAGVLGPSETGSFALAVIIGGSVKIVAGLGFERTILRFVAELHGQPMASRAVWWLLLRTLAAAVLASAALALAAPTLGIAFRDPRLPMLLIVGAMLILLELVGRVLEAALEGGSRFDLLARNSVTITSFHFVSTLGALALTGTALGVMLAQLATGLFGLILTAWFARRASLLTWKPGSPDAEITVRMLRFARHGYWLGVLAFVVHDRVEVLLLGALTTSDAIGFYTAALGAAEAAMGIGPWVVASVFFPLLAGEWSPDDPRAFRARYAQCARYLTFAAAPLALGGIALAEAGVAVFLGDAYAPMVPVLRVTLLATSIAALAQGPTAVLATLERQDWLLRVSGPLALANLLLDLALVPSFAALGAAWANLAVAIAEATLFSVVAWRLAGVLPPPQIGLPYVAAGLAAVAASLALGDRLDALGLFLGMLAAIPVYVGALVACRFFRKEDAEVVAPLVARLPLPFCRGQSARLLR